MLLPLSLFSQDQKEDLFISHCTRPNWDVNDDLVWSFDVIIGNCGYDSSVYVFVNFREVDAIADSLSDKELKSMFPEHWEEVKESSNGIIDFNYQSLLVPLPQNSVIKYEGNTEANVYNPNFAVKITIDPDKYGDEMDRSNNVLYFFAKG